MDKDSDFTKQLEEMQHELDRNYIKHAKKEFEVNLEHYNNIKPLLEKRDAFIVEKQGEGKLLNFWEGAFLNYDMGIEILPSSAENEYDIGWIKSLKVEYLEEFECRVRIELFDNDYVENSFLEKRMYLTEQEVDTTKVVWKGNTKYPIFMFFESDEEEYEVFDILYELYTNAYFYYSLSEE